MVEGVHTDYKVADLISPDFLKSTEEVFRFLEVTVGGELSEMHGLLGQGASGADQRVVQVGVFGKQVTAYQGGVQGSGRAHSSARRERAGGPLGCELVMRCVCQP